MTADYSVKTCQRLADAFADQRLYRPQRFDRYDAGAELSLEVMGVMPAVPGQVRLRVERFVGGGFAGQVYQVTVLAVEGELAALEVGARYAMKILVPPSGLARTFRDAIYAVGFQGPFQLQCNPAAARAGALWQKFIRRAAGVRWGDERHVVDIHATFVDERLGSCGELSEWVEGRTWQLEVDDRLDLLKRWRRGQEVDQANLGSPEYRDKKLFMADFVRLLHEVGAYEFARQYEWWTCKSQPNCLKRLQGSQSQGGQNQGNNNPIGNLVAVDFRAGLALLPFLPMSPGDFLLIVKGLCRGSLVQFDRGSIARLEAFTEAHPDRFVDMDGALAELKEAEQLYRDSVPDVTHNHVRLLGSPRLWRTMCDSAVTGWRVRNHVDDEQARRLRENRARTVLFGLLSLVTLLGGVLAATALTAAAVSVAAAGAALIVEQIGVPSLWLGRGLWWVKELLPGGVILFVLGRLSRRWWGRADWRRHYLALLGSWTYMQRALRGRAAEALMRWHRRGRVEASRAQRLIEQRVRFFGHLLLSPLPAGLHRFLTDGVFARGKLAYLFVRPVRLYFNAGLREQWLRDMVSAGRKRHMLSQEDAETILARIDEPFIQKYLKSLAVHLGTLPVTQVVSVLVAWFYVQTHPELTNAQQAAAVAGILLLFQITPISPGSLCRGLYVVYLVVRERNFKDYNIAVFLGFFKYVGYLAFPIQMAYRYPVLARFMAAHWATSAVHVVPVFGEGGALLEHGVFGLFYNWPLTVRRRMERRAAARGRLPRRSWHVPLCGAATAGLFLAAALYSHHWERVGVLTTAMKELWWVTASVGLLGGALVTLGAGSTGLLGRFVKAAGAGVVAAVLIGMGPPALTGGADTTDLVSGLVWAAFIFALLGVLGAILTELRLPGPRAPEERT